MMLKKRKKSDFFAFSIFLPTIKNVNKY